MDENSGSMKLYDLLTQEIQSAENQTYQIVSIGIGALAAILAAGFNQSNHVLRFFMFLTAYLIIIPMIRLLKGNRSRIWRIATYMQVFLEPALSGIKWQTHLAQQRESGKSTFIPGSQMLIVQLGTAVVGIATLANLFLIWHWKLLQFVPRGAFVSGATLAGAMLIFVTGALWRYESRTEIETRRGGAIEQGWLKSWIELSQKLNEINAQKAADAS